MNLSKKFSCLIVDDEPPARQVLRRYIQQIPMLEMVAESSNALEALSVLQHQTIDLLFLDIQMPQVSGMDLISTLKVAPKIILTTAFENYAVQAFEMNVTDYLVKPIRFERFLKAVMKALPQQEIAEAAKAPRVELESNGQAFLYFRADRKMVKVFLNDILYVESMKDYVKLVTTRGTIITKHAMASLEAMLPGHSFLRVHRSYLVALQKIDSFTHEEIGIQQTMIPIGKLYRLQVLKVLTDSGEKL